MSFCTIIYQVRPVTPGSEPNHAATVGERELRHHSLDCAQEEEQKPVTSEDLPPVHACRVRMTATGTHIVGRVAVSCLPGRMECSCRHELADLACLLPGTFY